MESYSTIAEKASGEFVEKKSRFIGTICPVSTETEAVESINAFRGQYWDATHNCYAYMLREGNLMRYSDDGEPKGTAGMPILEVVRREALSDILVVVTRYFGGTLLGAGGLVRAYARGAKLAVDAAERVEMCECVCFSLATPYPMYERVLKLIEDYPVHIKDTVFSDMVTLQIRMREDGFDRFSGEITELSSARVSPQVISREFAAI